MTFYSWVQVKQKGFDLVEDPLIGGAQIPIEEFENQFHAIIAKLDGSFPDRRPSFYFEQGVLNPFILRFKDEEKREDFYDWGVDLGICEPIRQIQTGETDWDTTITFDFDEQIEFLRQVVKEQEATANEQQGQKKQQKKRKPKNEKEGRIKALKKLKEKLTKAKTDKQRNTLTKKIERAEKAMIKLFSESD